jgi:hypothetical protein
MPLSGIIVLIAIASGMYYVSSYAKLSEKYNAARTHLDFERSAWKNALWRMRFAYLHKGKDLPFQFEDAALEWANRILGDYKPDPKTLNECTAELSKQREESKA